VIDTEERVKQLVNFFEHLQNGENQENLVADNREWIENCVPADVASLVDQLVSMEFPMDILKSGIDKLMYILRPTIENYPYSPPTHESYLGCLLENNRILDEKLRSIQPLLKQLNVLPADAETKVELNCAIKELNKFRNYYEIKESILFPEIRRHIAEHGCLSVMSSCHREIEGKLELASETLDSVPLDLDKFNRITRELLLTMYEIKFREEKILYTIVQESISEPVLNSLYEESFKIGFPYFQPAGKISEKNKTGR
jgi:hypothetical protein